MWSSGTFKISSTESRVQVPWSCSFGQSDGIKHGSKMFFGSSILTRQWRQPRIGNGSFFLSLGLDVLAIASDYLTVGHMPDCWTCLLDHNGCEISWLHILVQSRYGKAVWLFTCIFTLSFLLNKNSGIHSLNSWYIINLPSLVNLPKPLN